jgi:tetratricopeptide (TPR) repeat protein
MIKNIMFLFCFFISGFLVAQDVNTFLKEAENFERSFKEPEALAKYKEVLIADANNMKVLVKAVELSTSIGARTVNKNDKRLQYETALAYAKRAITVDANNADANYAMACASGKMTEVADENKLIVAFVKDTKTYVDKALSINPNHAKANFTLGRWHFEMVNLSSFKKAAVKVLYGGLPPGTLEQAIEYFEKCKSIDPYFVINYYYLNKAYKADNKMAKQMEVLNKLVKLPTRAFDDIAMKAEAVKELQDLQ